MAPTSKTAQAPQEKFVLIDNKKYTLDSDNTDLLKKMPEVSQYDREKKKWVKVAYPYIPINIIRTLLGGLTDSYDFEDQGAKWTGEEFVVEKVIDGEKKQDVRRVYEYTVKFVITLGGYTRTLQGYCRGVASKNILAIDGSLNGFFQKLSARATKAALKHFAKVFRMDDEADDIFESDSDVPSVTGEEVTQKPYTPKEDKKKSSTAKAATGTVDAVMAEIDTEPKQQTNTEDTEAPQKTGSKTPEEIKEINNKAVAELEEGLQKQSPAEGSNEPQEPVTVAPPAAETNEEMGKRWLGIFVDALEAGKDLAYLNQIVVDIRSNENIGKDDPRIKILKSIYSEAKDTLSKMKEDI